MELLQRLRDPFKVTPQDATEAADEIERLKGASRAFAEQVTNDYKEIKRLREALADIANIVNPYEEGDTMQEIARSALQQMQPSHAQMSDDKGQQ